MLRDGRHGIVSMIEIMNDWLDEWSGKPNFLLVRYEDLQRAPEESFRELLRFLGNDPEAAAFSHALEFSRFGNMKKLEAAGAFASKILQPTDAGDPESFKVRRGKVGGYTDYLAGDDLACVGFSRPGGAATPDAQVREEGRKGGEMTELRCMVAKILVELV